MTAVVRARNNPADVPEHQTLYWILWFSGWAIVIALLLVGLATWDVTLFDQYGITFNGGPTAILAAIVYFALSMREAGAKMQAGAFCYGKALVRLHPGPQFIPLGLMQIEQKPREVQEFQAPGEPEQVFKGDDKDPLPNKDMVRPIRVVTRAPKQGAQSKGILDTQMSFTISIVFQYMITDIFDFVANFGGSTETVHIQMRDIGETSVAEYATTKTTAEFIEGLPKLNLALCQKIQERFEHSGVRVISARLIAPDVTHNVSTALASIPIARAAAAKTEIEAAAEGTRLTKVGTGAANAKRAMLLAEAEGRKKMMDSLEVTGDAVLASESARGILAETDVLLLGESGMRDAMGLVKAAQSALNSGKKGAKP